MANLLRSSADAHNTDFRYDKVTYSEVGSPITVSQFSTDSGILAQESLPP
jgi:hypothetical protein